ncbi:MAG: hypothetical protein AB1716_15005, partial [Planctomycetota bacterium]
MAKQKRLNKNLIAFLTSMGILLVVAVFGLVIYQQSRRDPKVLEELAVKSEQAGDLGEAAKRYRGAWNASVQRGAADYRYIVSCSRCLLQMGEIGIALSELEMVLAKEPDNLDLAEATLDLLWQIYEIANDVYPAEMWVQLGDRLSAAGPAAAGPASAQAAVGPGAVGPASVPAATAAAALAASQPTPSHVRRARGFVARALGLWHMPGEQYAAAGEAATQAYQLAPEDPRVVLTYIQRLRRDAGDRARRAAQSGDRTERDRINEEFGATARSTVEQALAANPGNPALAMLFSNVLDDQASGAAQAGQPERAAELARKAGEVLTVALEQNPENGELYLALARHDYGGFVRAHQQLDPNDLPNVQTELEPIAANLARALEKDQALYDAWSMQAELRRFDVVSASGDEGAAQRLTRMLDVYDEAKEKTIQLRSLRRILREEDRLIMLHRAFDVAANFWIVGRAQTAAARDAQRRAETYVSDMRARYPEHPLSQYAEAEYLAFRNERAPAIKLFLQVHEKVASLVGEYSIDFWRRLRVTRLPAEHLVLLNQDSEPGEALRWSERMLAAYRQDGTPPPLQMVLVHAQLLMGLDQTKAALTFVDECKRDYPTDESLQAVRARLLVLLNRKEEATQATGQLTTDSAGVRAFQGHQAFALGDVQKAEALFRSVIDDPNAPEFHYQDGLRSLVDLLEREGKREEARQLVLQHQAGGKHPDSQRLYDTILVWLNLPDPAKVTEEERQAAMARLEEIIGSNPDPVARLSDLHRLHVRQGNWEKAYKTLAEMLTLPADGRRLDDIRIIEQQFRVLLVMGRFDEADKLAAQLAQHDNGAGLDGAGGATYRGELALALVPKPDGSLDPKQAEAAVKEFRKAVQALPPSYMLQFNLGKACYMAHLLTDAAAAFERGAELNPRSFEVHQLAQAVYADLAQLAPAAGERDQALARMRDHRAACIRLNPNHPVALAWQRDQYELDKPADAIAQREKLRADAIRARAEASGPATASGPAAASEPAAAELENLARLGELYVRATAPPTDPNPQVREALERQRQALLAPADKFFNEVVPALKERAQLQLAEQAAHFYAQCNQADKGEALLRPLIEQAQGEYQVGAALVLAGMFERLENLDAAEREIRQAQKLVGALPDQAARRNLELRVGIPFITFLERHQRTDKAVEACRWLIDRLSGDPAMAREIQDLRLRLLQSLYNGQQFADMKPEIESFLRDYPEDPRGLVARAQFCIATRDRDGALQDLSALLAKNPDDVLSLYSRGRLLLERGNYQEARDDLTKAEQLLAVAPDLEVDVRTRLAALHARTRSYELAAQQLQAALLAAEKLGAPPAVRQRILTRLVRMLYAEANQFEQAQKIISEEMAKHPEDPIFPAELARLFEARGKSRKDPGEAKDDYEQAATYHKRAAERAPKGSAAAVVSELAEAEALIKADRGRDALKICSGLSVDALPPLLQGGSRAHAEMISAKALDALKQPTEARAKWQHALEVAAQTGFTPASEVASELSKAWKDRTADAENLLRAAVTQVPLDQPVGQRLRIVLATYLTDSNRAAEALPLLKEVLAIVRNDTEEWLMGHLRLARTNEQLKDIPAAVQAYTAVLQRYPTEMTALNNLAYTLVTAEPPSRAPAQALKYAEQLRRRLVGNETGAPTVLDTVGWVYF